MTQPDMASRLNAAGVSTTYRRLVNIETGRTAPTVEEKKAIARILRVPVKEAFPQ